MSEYTARHRAMLLAVAQGRARLTVERCPAMTVDGRWCDPAATSILIRDGLVRRAGMGVVGSMVPAAVTEAGHALLATFDEPRHAVG